MKRGRPRVYSDRTSTSFSCEKAVLEDFLELCWKEKTSLGEKLQTIMEQELKKSVGILAGNPINISYIKHIKPPYIEPLDKYLEENFVTSRDWFSYYSKIDDIDHVQRHEALAVTIHKQAKQRVNYLKTGKYLVQ